MENKVQWNEQVQSEGVDLGKKTIALYLVGAGYIEHLGALPFRLHQKGYNVLLLFGNTPEQVAQLYSEAQRKVKIDFCMTVGLIDGMPENMIHFVHDIHDSALTTMEKIYRLMPRCQYIMVPNEPAFNRYKEMVIEGRKKYPTDKGVCFVPVGYPKLDGNIRYFQEQSKPPTAIIFATTIVEDIGDIVALPKHADPVIGAILDGIPDKEIIFRPHPGTMCDREVATIAQKYGGHPRFTLDLNPSFYMDNYAKSALMVTDMSGTAFTYAFTTLRPVIFFSYNEPEVQRKFGSYQYFIDRDKVGCVAEDTEELVEKIKLLLANNDGAKIAEFRDSFIYNIGKSEDYFMDNFEYIIENKKHPDWVYI